MHTETPSESTLNAPATIRLPIDAIIVPEGRRRLQNVEELARSMEDLGQLNPITVTANNRLIAGNHRLEAAKLLNWSHIYARVVSLNEIDIELAEIDENLIRIDLTVLERAEHYKRRKELFEAKHPETRRGVAGGLARQGLPNEIISFAEDTATKARVSTRTVQQEVLIASRLDENAKNAIRDTPVADSKTDLLMLASRPPELQREIADRIIQGTSVDVKSALRDMKEAERAAAREVNERLVASASSMDEALGAGRFTCVVVDPPWRLDEDSDDGEGLYGRGTPPYALMPFEEIQSLPVDTYSASDAHLYLWCTAHSMTRAYSLVEHWGFRFGSLLVWTKPSFGLGRYFRGATEFVVFGVRGSLPLERRDVPTWFQAARGPGGHSSKPDEFYSLVETCSPGPRLELFARRQRPGWIAWGAEVPADGTQTEGTEP